MELSVARLGLALNNREKLSGFLEKGVPCGQGGFADVFEGYWQKELGGEPLKASPATQWYTLYLNDPFIR